MSRPPILAIDGTDDDPALAVPDMLERLRDGTPANPDKRARETPVGDDDRTPVSDPTAIPYRRICQINYKAPRPNSTRLSPKRGTGWLIGPRVMLTAGHVVLDLVNKGHPENLCSDFLIAPGRVKQGSGLDAAPYGLYRAARLMAHPRWLTECDPDYDIGCIYLDRPVPGRVGYWGFAAFDDSALEGAEVNLAGYPVEGPPEDPDSAPIPIKYNGMKAFWHRNRLDRLAPQRLYYAVDTSSGQSGAPVWMRQSAQEPPVVVGVHAYGFKSSDTGDDRANSATRITPELITMIRQWMTEAKDGEAPAAAADRAPASPPATIAACAPGEVASAESGAAGQEGALLEFRHFLQTNGGEEAPILISAAESGDLGPDAGQFAVSALTTAAESCDAMIARLLRRCRVQQRLDLWSSLLTLVLGSSLFALSQGDSKWTFTIGVLTVGAAILSLLAKRMGGGEGGLMAKYVDLHSLSAEARLQADTLRHKQRSRTAIVDAEIDAALATTRRLTKEKGWMQASDFLFADGGFFMTILGGETRN